MNFALHEEVEVVVCTICAAIVLIPEKKKVIEYTVTRNETFTNVENNFIILLLLSSRK